MKLKFHETIKGLVVIRAFRQAHKFSSQSETFLKNYTRASYASMAASQWLNFRLQMISVLMITVIGLTAVIQHVYTSTANASLIGLALSYILSVTGLLNGVITSFTETEKEMVSVERTYQFQNLESENWEGISNEVRSSWPQIPFIEFQDVVLKYKEDAAPALNNISFKISAGEKVGICGRTGSGKSSLLMAIFRGVELNSGCIRIDHANIRNLDLVTLRKQLNIIPQEPYLFEGTLRENLDTTGEKSDEELWQALRETRFDLKFRQDDSVESGLDTRIEEKGKNFSCGERQLLCLARAILTNRKILCIDEATASVDYETDHFIQETIRTKFRDTTVLTIAHRVNTIVDYDRVIVMENGRVAEFGRPKNLLANKYSLFYNLVNEGKTKV
jgi:ATP-binding cassette subfamily C (CFTR/MRP) protein 10